MFLLLWLAVYEWFNSSIESDTIGTHPNKLARSLYTYDTYEDHTGYMEQASFLGKQLYYLDRGKMNGRPLILVHGTPTNSWLRRKMISWLTAQWRRVIVPDMPWFGVSQKVWYDQLDIATQGKALIWLIEYLKLEDVTIAWHDQWSLRMQQALVSRPDLFAQAIFLNGIYDMAWFHPPKGFGEKNLSTKMTAMMMGSKFFGRIFAYGAMIWWLKHIQYATPTMIHGYLPSILINKWATYYHFISDFSSVTSFVDSFQKTLPSHNIPIHIIRWAHDKILVWSEQIPVLESLYSIPESNIHILEDCAHFIQEECGKDIVDILRNIYWE